MQVDVPRRRSPLPRKYRKGCDDGRFLGERREREENTEWQRPIGSVGVECPERERGGGHVEMRQRALREKHWKKGGAERGCDGNLSRRHSLAQAKNTEQRERRNQQHRGPRDRGCKA